MNVERNAVTAHFSENLGTDGGEILADIAHSDRKARRAKPPDVTTPTALPWISTRMESDRTGWRLVRFQTHAFSCRALGDLVEQSFGTDEPGLFAHWLGDRPGKTRIDGIDVRRDVLAVQAEAGFKPQTVARSQADPAGSLIGQNRGREGSAVCREARSRTRPHPYSPSG